MELDSQEIINIFGNVLYTSVLIAGFITLAMIITTYRVKKLPILKYLIFFILPGMVIVLSDLTFFMVKLFPHDPWQISQIQTGSFYLIYSVAVYTDMYFSHKILNIPISGKKHIIFIALSVIHLLDFPRKLWMGDLWDRDITILIVTFFFIYLLYLIEKNKHKMKWPVLRKCYSIYRVSTIAYILWSWVGLGVYKLSPENYFYLEIANLFLISSLIFNGLIITIMIQLLLKTKEDVSPAALEKHLKEDYSLSNQETALALLLKDGKSSKDIGEKLFISPQTVKNYTSKVYRKLEVKNKFEFIAKMKEM